FPNVCLTPAPPGPPVPIPYPSIGQLNTTQSFSTDVNAGQFGVVTVTSNIPTTTGDAAGTVGGVTSGTFGQKVEFTKGSATVFANGNAIVRLGDPTKQNNGNAVGTVLGGFPTVLVGG
ncbi:MAG: PAAR-like domain-containing protein, partial [Sphingorhabdus sp.]